MPKARVINRKDISARAIAAAVLTVAGEIFLSGECS
jgi:hypothetical protein